MTETAKKTHKSRFHRSEVLPGFSFQERDRNILVACFEYRYLTRLQIQQLADIPCVTRVNIRLRKLFDHQLLDRRFIPTPTGTLQTIYFVGRRGDVYVAQELGLESKQVARRIRHNRQVKIGMISHDLAVNDFRIDVVKQVRGDERFIVEKWLDPGECERRFELNEAGRRVVTTLKPDGFFQVLHNGQRYSFFVEVDLSTSNHKKLASKFTNYVRLRQPGLSASAYGIQNYHVLVITKSASRRSNLKKLIEDSFSQAEYFWFANCADLGDIPFTVPIWYRTGQEHPRALFQSPKVRVIR